MSTSSLRHHSLTRLIGRGTAAVMATGLLVMAAPADAHRGRGSVGVFIGAPVVRPWAPVWGGSYYRRPHVGWWGPALPVAATVVTVGGGSYWYADGWYYRAVPTGGYEVVQPPVEAAAGTERLYVYPTKGQSAEQQASDEYECHRWAADQSGYDPTAAATGTEAEPTTAAKKPDYARAQAACLTGRGYSVK